METPLARRELHTPGLMRRWFGRPLPTNAYVEIENLLASRHWTDIEPEQIHELLRKHGAKGLDKARAKLLFEKALQTCVMDDMITNEEIVGLDRLQDLFGLRDQDVREIFQRVTHPKFRMALADVFADGVVTQDESDALAGIRKALRIDERAAREMWTGDAQVLYQRALNEASSDQRLSSDEMHQLDALASNFRITIDADAATQGQLARFRWFWLMENGTFPEVSVPIALQKKEVCHFSCSARQFEMRTELVRVNYGGPSARIRIMKGVYYRFGSVQTQRITRDVLREVDAGDLYVTNKRVIFDGAKKNSVVRLSNILAITPYTDAVELEKTSGRNPIFAIPDSEWLSVLLSSLLAHSD
jgi:hypothetical protein